VSGIDGRPYDPGNVTWLTEWALNGTIPANTQSAGAGRKEVAAAKNKDEVIKEVAGRKNGRG